MKYKKTKVIIGILLVLSFFGLAFFSCSYHRFCSVTTASIYEVVDCENIPEYTISAINKVLIGLLVISIFYLIWVFKGDDQYNTNNDLNDLEAPPIDDFLIPDKDTNKTYEEDYNFPTNWRNTR